MGVMPHLDTFPEDEEDLIRGDMFDQVSPRELAIARFQQNHEWLEEVLSSPYRIDQIEFSDLGLGLKGELASLTKGIFTSQGADALLGVPQNPYTGKLDEGKAELFRKRVEDHISSTKGEIERMKAEHDAMMAKFKGNSLITRAEKDLRSSINGIGPEIWRLEGRISDDDDDDGFGSSRPQEASRKMDEVVSSVENALGRHVQVVNYVKRVQDGGYREQKPEPVALPDTTIHVGGDLVMSRQASHAGSQHSGLVIGDSDIEMGGTAGSLLDQIHSGGVSSTPTPNNFPTPQAPVSTIPSAAATPANIASPHPTQAAPDLPTVHESIKEAGTTETSKVTPPSAPDQGTGSGDWIMVSQESLSPAVSAGVGVSGAVAAGIPVADMGRLASTNPVSVAGTPADDFSSLADLDTAGEAMETLNDPGLGEASMDLDMDDTNFGDAFHGIEGANSNTPGGGM